MTKKVSSKNQMMHLPDDLLLHLPLRARSRIFVSQCCTSLHALLGGEHLFLWLLGRIGRTTATEHCLLRGETVVTARNALLACCVPFMCSDCLGTLLDHVAPVMLCAYCEKRVHLVRTTEAVKKLCVSRRDTDALTVRHEDVWDAVDSQGDPFEVRSRYVSKSDAVNLALKLFGTKGLCRRQALRRHRGARYRTRTEALNGTPKITRWLRR